MWWLIAYDVASPSRLRRVHRLLRQEGVFMQRSVALVWGERQQLLALEKTLLALLQLEQDALAIYRLATNRPIYLHGDNPLLDCFLSDFPLCVPLEKAPFMAREDKG